MITTTLVTSSAEMFYGPTSAGSFYRDDYCPDCRQMTAGDCGKHGYQLPYYPDALKGQPGVIVVEERQHWTREELKALIREVLAEDMRRAMQMGTIQVEP